MRRRNRTTYAVRRHFREIGETEMIFATIYIQNKDSVKSMLIMSSLAACLILTGCGRQSATVAKAPGTPPEVGVVVIRPQRVALTTELAGRTSAHLIAEVRPQVGGIIQKRLFTEGSDVQAGDVLYQIDPSPFEAAHNSALANLDAV